MLNPVFGADLSTRPPLVIIDSACKTFGKTAALRGASFELLEGELLGLLGPNGAGKTTVIRGISARTRLDSGSISFLGKQIQPGHTPLELGIVPQELAVYPLLTARENLEAFGRLQGLSGKDLNHRVDWALEWTNLADRQKDFTKNFSGGMKRRLNLGCAVLHKPRVLLLDEPTVGVDPQSREKIYEMLAALRKEKTSILLTTHHLEEAELRCDRIVIIDHGKIIASGPVSELLQKHGASGCSVSIRLDQRIETLAGVEVQDNEVRAHLQDLGAELPLLLARIQSHGRRVETLELHRATLQSVFLNLTGKDLRE